MNESFREGLIAADGFHIRYWDAGSGAPLVHLHGAGGPRLNRAHDLLAQRHRVVVFEMPGFGASAENTATATMAALATTMARAVAALGIETCNLIGTSFGGKVALWLAAQHPDSVSALVLEAPAAIRQAGVTPPSGSPAEVAKLIYAHPDRMPPVAATDPAIAAKTQALVGRLRGPDRDAALEHRMRTLATPTLVLFGTMDRLMRPELGRLYKQLLPNAHLVFVHDAGHAIAAERPEAFAEVTLDFLDRHEAFVINRTITMIHP